MDNNYFFIHQKEIELQEDTLKEKSTISPSLTFLHQIITAYLQELSFYLLELKELGITNEKIRKDIMSTLASILTNTEYNSEQFFDITSRIYLDMLEAKKLYISVAERHQLKPRFFKSHLKNPKKIVLSDAIREGQKIFNQKFNKFTREQIQIFQIMLNLLKSICVNLIELEDLGFNDKDTFDAVLKLLSLENEYETYLPAIQEMITEFVNLDHVLLLKLAEIKEEKYGKIRPIDVSTSIKANKAILFAGTNLYELEMLLEATKDKGVDVYTHGYMLIAHAYPKFNSYPHLVGHWGTGPETYMIDFAQFPGAIFISKLSLKKMENLYQSRAFTTDEIVPQGVIKIKDYNFEPLIKSALNSKGFTKSVENSPIKINQNEEKILKKIQEIAKKVDIGEIKHLFAIAISNNTKSQKDYFDRFLELLPDNSYTISFSYKNNKDNVLFVQSNCAFPMLYKALDILTNNKSISKLKISILFTRFEVHTISNIIYLKKLGINDIYVWDSPSVLINPILLKTIKEMFGLKSYTTPEADIKAMIENDDE